MNAQLLSQMVILQQQTLQAQTAYYKAQADQDKLSAEHQKKVFQKPDIPEYNTPLNYW